MRPGTTGRRGDGATGRRGGRATGRNTIAPIRLFAHSFGAWPLGLICWLGALACVAGCGGGRGFFSLPDGGAGTTDTPSTVVTASLSGVVRDSITQEPLAGAVVVFGGNRFGGATGVTGDDGAYTFQNVTVIRRAQRIGVTRLQTTGNTVSLSISLSQYASIVLDLTLDTSGQIATPTTNLTPRPGSAAVSGTVQDAATRAGIADAAALVGTGQAQREARTDNQGNFLVTGLDVSQGRTQQQLLVNATNYANHLQILSNLVAGVTFAIPNPIEMLPQGTTVTVTGTVRDEDGVNLSDVSVRVGTLVTQTQANGFYQLSGITVGVQTFTFSAPGFLTSTFSIAVTGSQGSINVVLFRSGVNPPATPFTVSGRVLVNGAADSGGVKVSAIEQPGNTLRDMVTTAADGKFALFLPEGTYLIRAEKAGFSSQERTVVVPPGGQVVQNVDFTLNPS